MSNPFSKPSQPKNSLTLFHWLLFEPLLLERYERTLSKLQAIGISLKAISINFFVFIIPLTLLLYFIEVLAVGLAFGSAAELEATHDAHA